MFIKMNVGKPKAATAAECSVFKDP